MGEYMENINLDELKLQIKIYTKIYILAEKYLELDRYYLSNLLAWKSPLTTSNFMKIIYALNKVQNEKTFTPEYFILKK